MFLSRSLCAFNSRRKRNCIHKVKLTCEWSAKTSFTTGHSFILLRSLSPLTFSVHFVRPTARLRAPLGHYIFLTFSPLLILHRSEGPESSVSSVSAAQYTVPSTQCPVHSALSTVHCALCVTLSIDSLSLLVSLCVSASLSSR